MKPAPRVSASFLEIDRGVPTLHIDTGSDSLLHIHAAHDGLGSDTGCTEPQI
uniref:hypothetical protein n=1 Tax=Escherichia coli TaxID=562 RepID=UPI001F36FD76|nr:hypothetical protein [Escherichia coli]